MKKPRRAFNSTLPAPTAPIPRSRIAPRNAARKHREFARAYGSKERVAWIKSRPCAVRNRICDGPIENAHARGGGAGRKGDAATIVPLCRWHHRQLHHVGVQTFERGHGVNLAYFARNTERLWLAHLGGDA